MSARKALARGPGAFCALGMLQSDVRQDYLQVFVADLDRLDRAALDAGFAQLEARARDALSRDGFGAADSAIEREVDLRYDGQQWPVRVALNGAGFDAAAVRQAFEVEHQRLFGHIQPGGRIDVTALRVVGRGRLDWTPPATRSAETAAPTPPEKRKGWIEPGPGWRTVQT